MTHDEETEVAAEVIKDLLSLIPAEKRAAALAIASGAEAEEREKYKDVKFPLIWFKDLTATSPQQRYWGAIMKFKARLAYFFIRDITNSHSEEDASRLLFQQQHGVPGSGYLAEYLKGLDCRKSKVNAD